AAAAPRPLRRGVGALRPRRLGGAAQRRRAAHHAALPAMVCRPRRNPCLQPQRLAVVRRLPPGAGAGQRPAGLRALRPHHRRRAMDGAFVAGVDARCTRRRRHHALFAAGRPQTLSAVRPVDGDGRDRAWTSATGRLELPAPQQSRHKPVSLPAEPTFDDAFAAQFTTLLRWRRDVRHFRPDPVAPELLDRLVDAACLAPSVGYSQPWRFVSVESAAAREAVRANFERANAEALGDYGGERARLYASLKLAGLRDAPVQLAVFTDSGTGVGHGLGR